MKVHWLRDFFASATDALRLWSANRSLRAQLNDMDTNPAFDEIWKLDAESLKTMVPTEAQRSKDLDDKLSKLTAVLSVALTVSGVVTKMIADGIPTTPSGVAAVIILLIAMAFFFWGALIGFGGLRPKPKFGYGAAYLRIIAGGGEAAIAEMRGTLASFQVANAIQANYGSAAIDMIRNGIIMFAIGISVSVLVSPNLAASAVGRQDTQVVGIEGATTPGPAAVEVEQRDLPLVSQPDQAILPSAESLTAPEEPISTPGESDSQ